MPSSQKGSATVLLTGFLRFSRFEYSISLANHPVVVRKRDLREVIRYVSPFGRGKLGAAIFYLSRLTRRRFPSGRNYYDTVRAVLPLTSHCSSVRATTVGPKPHLARIAVRAIFTYRSNISDLRFHIRR